MVYEKLSPALAALVFEYLRFPDATVASVGGTRPQPLSFSENGNLQTVVFIYCDENANIENTAARRVNSARGAIRTARLELDEIAALSERSDVRYLACSMPPESFFDAATNGKNEKNVVVAPNRFAPARVAFVVPSSASPGSPREVVLRGWYEAEGVCDITILSPGGGTTRSVQAEVVPDNPTRFGNYHSSQAFLTKPTFSSDGGREFFIDLRPIAPQRFVTGGTWKLTVVNVGAAEVNVRIKSWAAENANDVNFI